MVWGGGWKDLWKRGDGGFLGGRCLRKGGGFHPCGGRKKFAWDVDKNRKLAKWVGWISFHYYFLRLPYYSR